MNLAKLKRKPDLVIKRSDGDYLRRWHILPRNRFFNIYLHHFLDDDEDRALHDHPWWSLAIILKGGYREHLPGGEVVERRPGQLVFRRAEHAHRVQLHRDHHELWFKGYPPVRIPAWTIFITGPRRRVWGFHCPKGWVPWDEFVDSADAGKVGRGCA